MSMLLRSIVDHLRANLPEIEQNGSITVAESSVWDIEDDTINIKMSDIEIEVQVGPGYAGVNRVNRDSMGEVESLVMGREIMTAGFGGNPLTEILDDVRTLMGQMKKETVTQPG